MLSHYKGTTKIAEVIRLELPYLPTNKSNNPLTLIRVSIKSAFPPIKIYCAMKCISFASQGFCYRSYPLSSVYKFFYATELFSFSSQTHLTIFFNLKPNKSNSQQPSLDPTFLNCSSIHLFIFIENSTKFTIFAVSLSSPSILPSAYSDHLCSHSCSERILPWSPMTFIWPHPRYIFI